MFRKVLVFSVVLLHFPPDFSFLFYSEGELFIFASLEITTVVENLLYVNWLFRYLVKCLVKSFVCFSFGLSSTANNLVCISPIIFYVFVNISRNIKIVLELHCLIW